MATIAWKAEVGTEIGTTFVITGQAQVSISDLPQDKIHQAVIEYCEARDLPLPSSITVEPIHNKKADWEAVYGKTEGLKFIDEPVTEKIGSLSVFKRFFRFVSSKA